MVIGLIRNDFFTTAGRGMLPRSKRFALAKCSRLTQTLGKREERGCKPRPAWRVSLKGSDPNTVLIPF